MSANPVTNDAVEINTVPVAEGGETLSGDTTAAVINSSYKSDSAARFSSSSQARIDDLNNATTFTDRSLAVFANTEQGVILKGNAGVTWGTNKGKAVQIGGAVIDASKAKRVVVTLSDNKANNAGSKTAPSRFIPSDVRDNIKTGRFNTISELSKGADQYTGTTAKDLASLGEGNDRANMGRGNDLVAMSSKLGSKRITLGGGKDSVLLDKGSLKSKGKVVIDDFNKKRDTLILETKASKVKGIGTETLVVSTKNGRVTVISNNDKFSRSSVDFTG